MRPRKRSQRPSAARSTKVRLPHTTPCPCIRGDDNGPPTSRIAPNAIPSARRGGSTRAASGLTGSSVTLENGAAKGRAIRARGWLGSTSAWERGRRLVVVCALSLYRHRNRVYTSERHAADDRGGLA